MAEKENLEVVYEDENLIDESSAADTLKPGAGSGGTESKAETLATFTSLLSQLGKEDLSKLFNDVQAQFGPGKAPGAEDKSASNKASVNAKASAAVGSGGAKAADPMPKLSVKEDIDDMFGADELSEDFREKASVVYEAALNTRLTLETARLEEQYANLGEELEMAYEEALEEQVNSIRDEIVGKIDQYLDYVVEQWMEENKVAIDNGLRADIAESFINSIHSVFTEHYITVPENKLDIVAELKNELDEVKAQLNEVTDEKLELQTIIDEATKAATIDEIAEGLAETQIEKLRTLAEGIDYTDAETYRKKLAIVKENYFTGKKTAPSTGILVEEIDGSDDTIEEEANIPANMKMYAKAISKSIK